MSKTFSWVVTAPGKMEMQSFDIPKVAPDALLMRVTMVTICGGDPHLLHDDGANKTKYPLILGHEMAGVVEEIGEVAEQTWRVKKGDRITVEPYIACGVCENCLSGHYQLCKRGTRCYGVNLSCEDEPHLWGAYGEYIYIAPGSMVHKIADGISDEAATMSSTVGNGYRFIGTKAQLKPNDPVLILGPGALGLCSVVAAKETGTHPIIVTGLASKDASRLALAKELGADYTIAVDEEDALERIKEITNGEMVKAAIECSGAMASYDLAFQSLSSLGTLVTVALTRGGQPVPVRTNMLMSKELQIKGSKGQPLNVFDAMKTINKGTYPIDKMVTHKFPMRKAPEAMEFFSRGEDGCIRVALYNE